MHQKRKRHQGFTLIELVICITIVGILAAIVLPKYTDLTSSANGASINTIAASITTATTNNFAFKKSGHPSAVAVNGTNVCSPAALGSFVEGGFPSNVVVFGFPIPGYGDCSSAYNNASTPCVIGDAGLTKTATVTVTCAR